LFTPVAVAEKVATTTAPAEKDAGKKAAPKKEKK
jgi:hypothetical protein